MSTKIHNNTIQYKYMDYLRIKDGPPFVTGIPHPGTAYNKILKDIVVRYAIFTHQIPYIIYTWDAHGLPIELKILKLNSVKTIKDMEKSNFLKQCTTYVAETQINMRKIFNSLNLSEQLNVYNEQSTTDEEHTRVCWDVFENLYNKGYIYEGHKVLPHCIHCATHMANSQIIYNNVEVTGYTVLFRTVNNYYLSIFTTTIWTLPFNKAVCYNRNLKYTVFEHNNLKIITVAKETSSQFIDVSNIKYYHPVTNKICSMYHADFVDDSGTGLVHICPAHGDADYDVGIKHNLDSTSHVNDRGYFNFLYTEVRVTDTNVFETYFSKYIYKKEKVAHKDMVCWRCNNLLIRKTSKQLFIKIEANKKLLLSCLNRIKFTQSTIKNAMFNWINTAKDWCISRSRIWGVPINLYYRKGLKVLSSEQLLQNNKGLHDMNMQQYLHCNFCFDVWYESGVYVYRKPTFTELIIEGKDQIRGWFYSIIVLKALLDNEIPVKEILTHGYLLETKQQKLSKSKHVFNWDDVNIVKLRSLFASKPLSDFIFNIEEIQQEKWLNIYENSLHFLKNLQLFEGSYSLMVTALTNWLINEYIAVKKYVIHNISIRKFNNAWLHIKSFITEKLSRCYIKYGKIYLNQFSIQNVQDHKNLQLFISDIENMVSIFLGHVSTCKQIEFTEKSVIIDEKWWIYITKLMQLRQMNNIRLKRPILSAKIPTDCKLSFDIVKQSMNILEIQKGDYYIDPTYTEKLQVMTNTNVLRRFLQVFRKNNCCTYTDKIYVKVLTPHTVNDVVIPNTTIKIVVQPEIGQYKIDEFRKIE